MNNDERSDDIMRAFAPVIEKLQQDAAAKAVHNFASLLKQKQEPLDDYDEISIGSLNKDIDQVLEQVLSGLPMADKAVLPIRDIIRSMLKADTDNCEVTDTVGNTSVTVDITITKIMSGDVVVYDANEEITEGLCKEEEN